MSAVECSERVQRYPGLFEVSRSLNAVVLDRWARYVDLRTARYRSDRATHTPVVDGIGGSLQVSAVEYSGRVQR